MPQVNGITNDVKGLLNLVYRLSDRKQGDDISPTFRGNHLNMSIVLIGRPSVVSRYGAKPYARYIEKAVQDGIETFYILARGKTNVAIAESVAEIVNDRKLVFETHRVIDVIEQNGYKTDVACIRLQANDRPHTESA